MFSSKTNRNSLLTTLQESMNGPSNITQDYPSGSAKWLHVTWCKAATSDNLRYV